MAQAARSLSPKQVRERTQLLRQAVVQLARLAAKRKVQDHLRAQGVRVSLFPIAELMRQAGEYLDFHPELYQQALERARRIDPRFADINTNAQKENEPKSTTSSAQMLGAK